MFYLGEIKPLSLKTPITTATEDTFFNFFIENKLTFHVNRLFGLADDSHEMSRLIFTEKKNRMSSATHFAWRFKS